MITPTRRYLHLSPLAALLAACAPHRVPPSPDAARDASSLPITSASAAPHAAASTPLPVASPPPDLADDLAARTRAGRAVFGAHARTRTLGGLYVLAGPAALGGLFDQAASLIERALPPLFQDRFTRHPDAAVTILLFASQSAYDDYVAAHYGPLGAGKYGLYQRESREIAADGSGGPNFLPTLTHEIVHPIIQADFPSAPLWFNEAVASVFEAPVFPADGGIHGTPRNWRHARLVSALASSKERESVHLGALFAMSGVKFLAWTPDAGSDRDANLLHCAMARELATWMDSRGMLWPFYHAWRDGFAADPTGEKSFLAVTGLTPDAADAAWLAWVR